MSVSKSETCPIGYHISFDGFYGTLMTAKSLGLPTFQMFIRNNRNLKMRKFTQSDYDAFNSALPTSGIQDIVVHASYAINPASGDPEKRERAAKVIIEDLKILQNINGYKYYVLHPGCHTEYDRSVCLSNLIRTIMQVAPYAKGTKICVETMAGEGTELISKLEEIILLCYCLHHVEDFRLCVDTCHLFGAGIDYNVLLSKLSEGGYLDKIGVVHVNGSKNPFNSRKDNHGSLMRGYLPFDSNVNFLKELNKLNVSVPVILESEASSMASDWDAITKALIF